MASLFDELSVKYKGYTVDKNTSDKRTTVIYQGSKELCEAAFKEFKINTNGEYGNIENVTLSPDEGPFWNLEVVYVLDLSSNIYDSNEEEVKGSSNTPQHSELTIRMMSMPLESVKNYKKKWNNNLYCTKRGVAEPSFWENATYNNDGVYGTEYEYDGSDIVKGGPYFFAWRNIYKRASHLSRKRKMVLMQKND